MKQIKNLLLILLFCTASIASSSFSLQACNPIKTIQSNIEIIDANETTDIKEEPSHIRISSFYQEFMIFANNYYNFLHLTEPNPFIPMKPPREEYANNNLLNTL